MSYENPLWNRYNQYQSNVEYTTKKNMIDDMIAQKGFDVFYLPKTTPDIDKLFGEDPTQIYSSGIQLTVYGDVKNWSSGEELFGKFGFISDWSNIIQITVGKWQSRTSTTEPTIDSLFYIPNFGKWFQVSSENTREPFYFAGQPLVYNIPISEYKFSHEVISTGVDDIDDNVPNSEQYINDENEVVEEIEKEEDILTEFDDLNNLFNDDPE